MLSYSILKTWNYCFVVEFINSSDSRVVRAFASGAVDFGLILGRIKPMTLKLGQLPCLTLNINWDDSVKIKPKGLNKSSKW